MSESTLIALKEFLGFLLTDIGDALVRASAERRKNYYGKYAKDVIEDDETNEGENV